MIIISSHVCESKVIACQSDQVCHSSLNLSYKCDLEKQMCTHKSLWSRLGPVDLLGFLVILGFNFISFVMGVTANGVSLPILVLFFDFQVKSSLAVLKMGNIFASTINLFFVLGLRHPKDSSRLASDFELVLFLISLMTLGSMLGFLLFNWIPSAVSYICIFVLMVILTYRNFFKMRQEFNGQSARAGSTREDSGSLRRSESNSGSVRILFQEVHSNRFVTSKKYLQLSIKSNTLTKTDRQSLVSKESVRNEHFSFKTHSSRMLIIDELNELDPQPLPPPPVTFWRLILDKTVEIALIVCCFVCLICANFVKRLLTSTTLDQVTKCSFLGIFLFFSFAVPLVFIAEFASRKLNARPPEQPGASQLNPLVIGSFCLIGGFISSVGVSGSLIVTCSLLVVGLDPLVVKSTIGIVLFGLTVNNLVQFSLSKYSDWANSLLLGCFSFVACLSANYFLQVMLRRFPLRHTNLLIRLCSFLMTFALCVVIPLTFYSEYLSNDSIFYFESLC